MKSSRYLRLEKYIAASDTGGVLERWRYGRRLLMDDSVMSASRRSLKPGVAARLVAEARGAGYKSLSERELQYRLRAARAYETEAQIRKILADLENWWGFIQAAFPPVQLPLDADPGEPFDPRDLDEKRRDAARELERAAKEEAGGQLTLFDYFPAERFSHLSTLAELRKYAEEMAEWTERQAEADKRRLAYVKQLLEAVHGDEGRTWAEAQAALDAA